MDVMTESVCGKLVIVVGRYICSIGPIKNQKSPYIHGINIQIHLYVYVVHHQITLNLIAFMQF